MDRPALLVLALALGCGGPAKPAAQTTPPPAGDGSGTACEPGRCLDDISRAIAPHKDEARKCYDQALEAKAGMGGKVFINFLIDPAGHVTESSQGMQDNQLTQPEIVDCVRKVVEAITFAKSPSGKTTRAYHRFEFAGK